MEQEQMRVAVIDMQPITPAVGGGRQRLLGLYHALGPDIECTYVGSYDWPGEKMRDQRLTPGLREIVVPLSPEHHAAAAELSRRIGGRTVIDIAFADQAHLSPGFLDAAREHIAGADVVVFSHPWCFPPLAGALRHDHLVIYDSQNVEAVLRMSLHEDLPEAAPLLRRIAEVEYALCHRADLILACSHEDRETFARLYELDWNRLRIAANGIFAFAEQVPDEVERREKKNRLRLDPRQSLLVFLGSNYGPNNEAAKFIASQLAPRFPDACFAIIGGCCNALGPAGVPGNVKSLGMLGEEAKQTWLRAADLALNPLTAGSGTSIKMFDFMATGLPVVATPIGARGIVCTGEPAVVVSTPVTIADVVRRLLADANSRRDLGKRARRIVEDFYAWERISPALGLLLRKRLDEKRSKSPFFSIVVPTYERHALLDRLMSRLQAQEERDFEVIVVDQSTERWSGADRDFGFPLHYVHTTVKGAVKARNFGGYLASGTVIAFTDDDCEPAVDWLANALKHFSMPSVAGVEGLIHSDHLEDPKWRPVSNIGFEGIGFMTANLFARNEIFQQLNGFDFAFDEPHFREDTDFGWRMLALGTVPYAADVRVYHPAHRRDLIRESQPERNRFFEKDALLLRKHPERYRKLLLAESHFRKTPGFWHHFDRGLDKYEVNCPEWIRDFRPEGSELQGKGVNRRTSDAF